jgi:hypothetical protein
MAALTPDERKTLATRDWEIDRTLEDWKYRLIRPPNYDELMAERDSIRIALQGGASSKVIGDTILPNLKELARDIAEAIYQLQQKLNAADAFTSTYGNLDEHGQNLVNTLTFPAGADPREATSDTRKWLDRAIRYGLVPR